MYIHNRLSIKAGIFPQVFIVQKKVFFFRIQQVAAG